MEFIYGWQKTKVRSLSDLDRKTLSEILSSRKQELRTYQRAQMIFLAAEGKSNTQISEELKVTRPVVNKIIKRFSSAGLDAALSDAARSGRPKELSREERAWILGLACTNPKDLPDGPVMQLWSNSALSQYVREHCEQMNFPRLRTVADSTIWYLLNANELKPHNIRYYLEKKDQEFEYKAQKVLLLYKRIEWITQLSKRYGHAEQCELLSSEVFISYDEKSGIQAIENLHPDRSPNKNNGFVRRDYEYVRHGTISLLAGIDLITGTVHGLVKESHKSSDFIDFLKAMDARYPEAQTINIILDNHSAHRSKETLAYLATVPNRFKFTFTPKHASWLNLVEAFFGKMARTCLKGLRVKSKEELTEHITRWLERINNDPVVYRWKWNLEDIEHAFT